MANKIPFTDEELLTKVRSGGRDFEEASMYLFEEFRGYVHTMKQKLHLPETDLQDAYADSLVKLLRKLKDGSFKGESKISSYFYTIYYNTCVDVSRKNTSNKNKPTEELLEYNLRERDLMAFIENKDEAGRIVNIIKGMEGACKKILIDWGYYGYSMEEIAKRTNLSSAESARSMKYKCLKKLKQLLISKM